MPPSSLRNLSSQAFSHAAEVQLNMSNILSHNLSWTSSCSLAGGRIFFLELKKGPCFWEHLGLIVVNCFQVIVLVSSFSRGTVKDNHRTFNVIDCDLGRS